MSKISLSFYGGAREVTGACYLLEVGGKKLLVDCGMLQDCEDCDARNHAPFPFDPSKVNAVIVTHAHIDHIGRIPKLYREGFRGAIYAVPPTRDLAEILLEDAMNFFHPDRGELFSARDLTEAMRLFKPVEYGDEIDLGGQVSFKLLPAGHILGSALVRFSVGGRIILFSGDVGNTPSILLPERASAPDTNILIVESTYGNKAHKHTEDRTLLLERAIEDAAARRGVLMIPVFATERTQEILFEMNQMIQHKRVPSVPVFLDSPLATKATAVFTKYPAYYRKEVQQLFREHRHLFDFKNLKFTVSVEESKAINAVPSPKVILAGSGMSTGGRILHHEKRYLPDRSSILLVTGFQSAGSLGRRLLDHEKEVRIHGEIVPVGAEVRIIDGYSAHADKEQLMQFVDEMRDNLEQVFVVQGEPDAALGLQSAIQDRMGVKAAAPMYGEKFSL